MRIRHRAGALLIALLLAAAGPLWADAGGAAHGVSTFLLTLAAMLVAAKLLGELAERIGQPAVLGELLAGVLLGSSALGVIPAAGADCRCHRRAGRTRRADPALRDRPRNRPPPDAASRRVGGGRRRGRHRPPIPRRLSLLDPCAARHGRPDHPRHCCHLPGRGADRHVRGHHRAGAFRPGPARIHRGADHHRRRRHRRRAGPGDPHGGLRHRRGRGNLRRSARPRSCSWPSASWSSPWRSAAGSRRASSVPSPG